MSWTKELYNVYEQKLLDKDGEMLPLSHSTSNAQIEITISENGEFVSAQTVSKEQTVTIIPVTEDSAARSSGICPHPFADKFIYIAGDYGKFIDNSKSDNSKFFEAYLLQLKNWAESEHSHPAVEAVYNYIQKKCLFEDLIKDGVILLNKETEKLDKSKINGILQEDCFVRFRVNYNDINKESRTWLDKSLHDKFIEYNSLNFEQIGMCYATGNNSFITYKHPSKIRNAGDKAKLISSNDEIGFTYRGRFSNKEQAVSVSYEFSQKMHNALKWLAQNQSIYFGGNLTLIAWESSLEKLPDFAKSAYELNNEEFSDEEDYDSLPIFKQHLNSMIYGRMSDVSINSKVMIMGLDSATTGRLSISMYTELSKSDFLKNVESWHIDTAWKTYSFKLNKYIVNSFSVYEIAVRAFGYEQEDNKSCVIKCKPEILKQTILRLVSCITEGRALPSDIINALVNKASNPLAYNKKSNHDRVVETACGMIKKTLIQQNKGADYLMALDENNKDRSYLYGRLLAVADMAEISAYKEEDNGKRVTNARRFWNRFSQRPYNTWQVIEEKLRPYLDKGDYANYYSKMLNVIMSQFNTEDFENDKKLSPIYLLGYHCQMNDFYKPKTENNNEE